MGDDQVLQQRGDPHAWPAKEAGADDAGELGGAMDRDRVEREAGHVDAQFTEQPSGPGPGPGAGPVPLAVNVVQENTDLLRTLVAVLTPVLPFLPDCYPPATCEAIATAWTAVEQKHNWSLRKALSEEGALLIVALPPTVSAVMLGRMHFARLKAEKLAAKSVAPKPAGASTPDPTPAPGSEKVSSVYPPMTDGTTLRRVVP